MKRLMILGAVWALAAARPEQYKEKEDFQYSRSSSDDGSKSGYYGAQRGNMGGNYERAHNMDSLAQNQMSGVVRQVDGELGDGARTRAGSVYTAANSRGTYGSGHFDLSNLAGRNFQEGASFGDSASLSSSSSSAYDAAGYANSRSQSSRSSGYQAVGHGGSNLQSDNLQSLDNTQGTILYGYGRQTGHSAGYNSQSGFQQHAAVDTSNSNLHSGGYGSNIHTRLISATPVRIIGRPGTRVAIPIAAQTYDITHGSSLMDQNSLNSDAEVLNTDTQRTVLKPVAKHYESSYNYRKEWEKHDTIPSTVFSPATSTDNPFPKNSELYEDSQAHTASHQYDARRVDSQRAHSSNVYSGYNANVKSTLGQSRLNYDTQHNGASTHDIANAYTLAGYNGGSSHHDTSSGSSSNGYNIQSQYNAGRIHGAVADSNSLIQAAQNTGFNTDLNSQVESLNTKPKSYQSSYSYHKSWERQGDPYIIKPASAGYYDGQTAQTLTTGTTKNLATGSHYQHSHQSGADCDENGHIRVARSYNPDQFQDMQQQSQNLEDLGQQVEDLGQQTQNVWGQQEDGQQVQNTWDNLEDLSQQSHNKWEEIQHTWDKFEDLGQKPQEIDKQLTNIEKNNQNDLGQRRQETATELKKHPQDQQGQNDGDFTNQRQEDKEHVYIHNQYHEQSSKLDEQVNQPKITEDDVYSSQTSQKLNNNENNQMNVWDKLDFGSFQNVDQNKNKDVNLSGHQINSSAVSQNKDLDQVPVNIGTITDLNKSEDHSVNNNSGAEHFWQQIAGNTQHSHIVPDINVPSNGGLFNLNNEQFHSQYNVNQQQIQKDENSLQQTHKLHESHNWNTFSSSHKHEHTTNTESFAHVNSFEANSPDSVPLSSIWGKLGNIEPFDKLGKVDEGEVYDFNHASSNSQNAYENSRRVETHNTVSTSQEHINDQMKHYHHLINNITEKEITQNNANSTTAEKESSLDVGRGDIGPEVVSDSKPYQHSFDTPINVETIQNSNQKEIDTDLPANEFSVMGLNHQNPLGQNKQNEHSATNTNNTHAQNNYQEIQHHENQDLINLPTSNKNLQQQNSNIFGHHISKEQKDFQTVGHHDYLVPLDKSSSEQESLTHLHDFRNNENPKQQTQHENVEQQNVQDFSQQENLEQQNLQDFGQQVNFEHQDLQNFGQHVNLEQQNLQDFGQQVNLEQQNLQDFGQQVNLEQQNLQYFGQQDNVEQHNLQDFGEQVNVEQQNLQDFGQQVNLEQQNLQDFGQQVNLEQQNLQDFGQQVNLEQQNLQDFGQQVNLEQQNLQDFGQQAISEQQNLQDFGQHVNSDQQNLEDFGQHVNSEHKKLHVFSEQLNSEQQNLQDFSQQENLEQHNLQDTNPKQQNSQNLRRQYTHPELTNQANIENSPLLNQQNIQDFNQNLEPFSQDLEQNFKYSGKHEQQQTFPKNNLQSQTYFPPPEESEELQKTLPKNNNIQSQQTYFPPPDESVETILVKKQKNDLQATSAQSPSTEAAPQMEPVTEKTGFWKSIGSKLSSAKSKIASWF